MRIVLGQVADNYEKNPRGGLPESNRSQRLLLRNGTNWHHDAISRGTMVDHIDFWKKHLEGVGQWGASLRRAPRPARA